MVGRALVADKDFDPRIGGFTIISSVTSCCDCAARAAVANTLAASATQSAATMDFKVMAFSPVMFCR